MNLVLSLHKAQCEEGGQVLGKTTCHVTCKNIPKYSMKNNISKQCNLAIRQFLKKKRKGLRDFLFPQAATLMLQQSDFFSYL